MFILLIGSTLALSAHAARTSDDPIKPSFVIPNPSVTMSDSGSVMTLSVTAGRTPVSLNGDQPATLTLACGHPNQIGTSLLAVTYNGEVKIVGRKKNCVETLARIAATPARFSLRIRLITDEVERATPGFEYEIQASAQ